MSEIFDFEKRDGYIYDPAIKAYDTSFWKSITGTPSISSNKIRYNAAKSASFGQHLYADIEFVVNVPVKPTAGDDRQWGLKAPATNNFGAAYFDITGTAFTANTYDQNGVIETTILTWTDADFSAHAIAFRIRWELDEVRFYVDGDLVATHTTRVPFGALPILINNGNSDNMDVSYIAVRRAAGII